MVVEERVMAGVAPPSKRSILIATGIAIVVAVAILFVAILPAEYGIDPLHTGRMLGLTELSKTTAQAAPGARAMPAQSGIYTSQPGIYKTDSEDMALQPGEGVELKYHMRKGAVMVYGWKADSPVGFEFHGEPDQKPRKDYFESYQLDDKAGQDHANGSFTAPSTGIHGWFWHNKGQKEVRIHLNTSGFYDSAKMYADGEAIDLTVEDAK